MEPGTSRAAAERALAAPAAAGVPVRSALRSLGVDLLACFGIAALLLLVFRSPRELAALGPRPLAIAYVQMLTITLCMAFVIGGLMRTLCPAFNRRVTNRTAQIVFMALLLGAGVVLGGEIALRIMAAAFDTDVGTNRPVILRVGFVVSLAFVVARVAFERMRERARETELREQCARQEALRAQLAALQARTNPHFLFNSLNTAAGLIETDPRGAERVLERLSGLFRYALAGSGRAFVRLAEEIGSVRDYLEVEGIRFGPRLEASIEVADGVGDALVPPLILQPLVENAVLHGIAPRVGGGRVRIRAAREAGSVVLSVEDDGPGPGGSTHAGAGTALADLRGRLRLVYGERASIETGAAPGGGFRATLRVPSDAR